MTDIRTLLDALMEDCHKRQLTPQAWWLGRDHHVQALEELRDAPDAEIEGVQIRSIGGLPVKHLKEFRRRVALWCDEGLLDVDFT